PVGSELRGDVLQKRLPAFVDRADEVKILHSVPDILKRFPSGKFQGIHFLIHTQHKLHLLALKLTLPLGNAVSETERRGSGITEIQDINQQDNADTDLACENRPQIYEFLHCRMQHTEQYHCKEAPPKRRSQTDPALEIKFLIAVIPPGGMEDGLHKNRCKVFQQCGHDHAAEIQQDRIVLQRFQDQIDSYRSMSVYRT